LAISEKMAKKIHIIKIFDWREENKAISFVARWRAKGFRVFDITPNTDTFTLVVTKSKLTKKDIPEPWNRAVTGIVEIDEDYFS
jgi:hypothetical protein